MVDNNEILRQILQLGQTLNTFQVQTNATLNELRTEIKKSREIENEHWLENLRRWEENDKRWEENKKLWKENNEKWKENKKMWIQNEINRKNDHQEIMDTFIRYDISVSKKLGDPNADKMKKFLKCN